LSAIGDVVVTTAAARELKRRYPGCLVAAVVEEKAEPIVRMNPYVDEIILFRVKTLRSLSKAVLRQPGLIHDALVEIEPLRDRLAGYRFDAAIDLHGMFRSGLLAWLSGAPKRIGYADRRELNRLFLTHRVPHLPLRRPGEEALRLLEPLGVVSADPTLCLSPGDCAVQKADELLRECGLDGPRVVALCPATTHPAKHWTESGWAQVAEGIRRSGGLPVFLGGPDDPDLIARINARLSEPCPSFAGRTSLEEAAALIRRASLTVAVDTALAHVSIAVGTPLVVLHGFTPFERMRDEPNVTVVADPNACGHRASGLPCPHCACMAKITPQSVLEATSRILKPCGQDRAVLQLGGEVVREAAD
jgi:heptosyltransferase-1